MILAAFILGITGSLHCVGMCGPIAILINGRSKSQYLINRLMYHAGRTFTYIMMGMIVGVLGKIFRFGGLQSILSLAGGIVIIGLLFLPSVSPVTFPKLSALINKLKRALGNQLRTQKPYSTMLTGVLNGFLPCGLVYSALALALVQSTVQESAFVMAAFGLGTVPVLLAFTYSATVMKKVIPFSVTKLQRVVLFAVAVIMIWRGVAFHLPEVFPGNTTTCHSVGAVDYSLSTD